MLWSLGAYVQLIVCALEWQGRVFLRPAPTLRWLPHPCSPPALVPPPPLKLVTFNVNREAAPGETLAVCADVFGAWCVGVLHARVAAACALCVPYHASDCASHRLLWLEQEPARGPENDVVRRPLDQWAHGVGAREQAGGVAPLVRGSRISRGPLLGWFAALLCSPPILRWFRAPVLPSTST